MTTHCGYVALIGAPNAGKSTLTNQLMGRKISIVTPKVQTTRSRILGICMVDQTQLILVDTPGIFDPKQRLDKAMVQAAWYGADDADMLALLVDAKKGICKNTRQIIEGLQQRNKKALLVLNKVDIVNKPDLLALIQDLNDTGIFSETFLISALKGDGVDELKAHLVAAMPESPWFYPEDQLTDITERLFAAEITREQLFMQLKQELPYALTVETESWEEKEDGSVRIQQVIYVQREGQKGIILGKQGQSLKKIGEKARKELSRCMDRTIHLFLFVKVREKWKDDPERFREMGLDWVK